MVDEYTDNGLKMNDPFMDDELGQELTYPKFDFNPFAMMSLKGLYWSEYGDEEGKKVGALREGIRVFGEDCGKGFCFYKLTKRLSGIREHYSYLLDGGSVGFVTANDYSMAFKVLPDVIPRELVSLEEAVHVLRFAARRVNGPHYDYLFRVFRAMQKFLLNAPDEGMVTFTSSETRVNFCLSWPKKIDRVVVGVSLHVVEGFNTQV